MAVSIPQVVTEDRASGALVVDGSLRFDQSKSQYLTFTPTTTGDRRTWTFSCWFRKMEDSANRVIFSSYGSTPWTAIQTTGSGDGRIQATFDAGVSGGYYTDARYRDNGWYHLVWAVDTTRSTDPDKSKLYINGVLQTYGSNAHPSLNEETPINLLSRAMYIGYTPNQMFDGHMSQCYLIDGQALGPEYFGYTDQLTGVWRPKKFRAEGTTLNDGTTFSSNMTGATNATNGFNGSLSNYMVNSAGATPMVLTATFRNVTSFRYYTSNSSAHDVSFNGGAAYRDAASTGWRTIPNPPSTITSISWIHSVTSATAQVEAVEINGEILLDSTTRNLAFGTNGFYLPMDGNSPIGQDQSGNGNDWTPVNFGGSAALDKATGALPILNTLGGSVARSGVFGSEVSKNYTTTSNTAAGSGFEFDQTSGFNPSLSFVRGATYTFDYTDSSSHPLRFSSTDPDSSVTSYTDGTNTSVSNTVKITVPHNAPDTLYYYCTSHNSMNGRISVTTDETKADPYAWKNVLAISGSGSILDSCASINCTVSNKTSTDAGSIAYNSNSNLYSQSIYSAGSTNQYFTVGSSTESDFDATGDFCFEFWHYPVTSGYAVHARSFYFGSADGSSGMQAAFYDGQVDISSATNGLLNGATLASSTQHKFDQWNHHAITREGNSVRYFQNGVLVDSATQTTPTGIVSGKRTLYIGGNAYQSPQYWQDIRFYNGVAKYTSNFIPASTNPDILPDTPSGVGTKTQLTKIPSSDSNTLLFPTQASKIVLGNQYTPIDGTGDYTISFWFFASEYNSADNNGGDGGFDYILTQAATHPSYPIGITISKAGKIVVQDSGNFGSTWLSTFDYSGSYNTNYSISLRQWSYVHVVRSSGTLYIYNNGNLQYSRSQSSSSPTPTGDITICLNTGSCFVKDFRIEGAAITDPTPPTGSPTATGNTRLLLDGLNDVSGNNVDLTVTGDVQRDKLSPFITTDINTIRGQEGAYATFNPLQKNSGVTLSNGNLKLQTTSSAWKATQTTIGMKTGKFYWEFGPQLWRDSNNHCQPGVAAMGLGNAYEMGGTNYSAFYHYTGTSFFNGQGGSGTAFGAAWNDNETNIIGIAFDADTRKVWFSKNGIWQGGGNPSAGTNEAGIINLYGDGTYSPTLGSYGSLNGGGATANFGQKPFKFPPPDGFQPLTSSAVRPDTVISRPDRYFGATLYTGNAGTKSIDVGHKPDFVWVKARTGSARSHFLFDSVRGVQKFLQTDGSAGESNADATSLTSFNNDGFTTGARAGMNENGVNYVAWTWKAGGNSNTFNVDDVGYASAAAAGLTAGDSSSVTGCSIGTRQGFSIIKYSGANTTQQIPHGLGQAPRLCIVKNLTDGSTNWVTSAGGSGGIFSDSVMFLNTTAANNAGLDAYWGGTSANSTVVYVGGNQQYTNQDSKNYIMYNWIDVPGLQKFGTYEGTGVAGNYVHLGFRPALIWIKNVDTTAIQNWGIIDSTRSYANVGNHTLALNLSDAESAFGGGESVFGASNKIDLLSDGFALRETTGFGNASGITFVYCAWAEAPQFNLYGAQSNAR